LSTLSYKRRFKETTADKLVEALLDFLIRVTASWLHQTGSVIRWLANTRDNAFIGNLRFWAIGSYYYAQHRLKLPQ